MRISMTSALTALLAGVCFICSPAHAQQRAYELDTLHVRAVSRVPQVGQAAFRSVDVVSRSDIERLPGRTLADVLARVLGVDIAPRSPAQADLSIRGSTFEQVLVLVDGVRVSDEQTGHFDLDLAVPLEMVERIEVLRGSGSAVHGSDAVGGVVNIVTSASSRVAAQLQGGSFGTGFGSIVAGTHGIQAGGDYARSDGHRAGTDYEIYQARASATRALRNGQIGLDLGFAVRDFGAADFYAPFQSHERTSTVTAVLRFEPLASRDWQVAPQLSIRRHTDRFTLKREDPSFYQNEHESWQTAAEVTARYAGSERFSVVLGGEAFAAGLESARLGDRMERRAALFTEATLGNVRISALNAGLRTDFGTTFSTFASPSLALTMRVRNGLQLRASAARGFRVPAWTERYYTDPANIGDPDLAPERFWTAEAGARLKMAGGFDFDVASFYRRSEDLIDWAKPANATPAAPWRTMNVEHADFRGVEARLQLPSIHGVRIGAAAMALSVDAADADGYISKYALRQITQQLGFSLEVPLLPSMVASSNLRNARRRLEGSFTTADLRASWTVRQFRVDVDVMNLTGASYRDASAKPVAGRAFSVGAAWRLR
ncbi:MAG: TonB-dependent receptor plug domain-containing protein [Gemmatimonadota bacterium]